MRSLRRLLLATLTLLAGSAPAAVRLTSNVFSSANLPYVWTDEQLPAPYRLRVKIGGSFHATGLYNNNWSRLETVPAPGTYLVELYWVLYDPADWSVVRQVGPFTTGTITVQPSAQPPFARSVSATAASPGQTSMLTGAASDGNGDLAWIHFFTNDPAWSGYVLAGSSYVGARADATASIAWTVPAGAPTGTYQAHVRAVDSTGLWDWNGGASSEFAVRSPQPPVSSRSATALVGQPFSPVVTGGAGNGPWQWVVGGRTNWGGAQPGTLLPPANTPAATWVPDAPGDYYFWVIRQGDASFLPSNVAGPYLLSVLGVPPAIVAQPASLTVNAGDPAAFSVTASGDAPLSFQWSRGGTDVPGATQARLALTTAQPSDAGSYVVTVRNLSGSATSVPVTLTVRLAPPAILTAPAGRTVPSGQTVTLSVAATGTPPLAFRWLKDGAAVAGATTANLTLSNPQPSDSGGYSVVVSNAAGTATAGPAILSVLPAPPAIVRHPASATVAVGQAVQFTVDATGSQPLSYQWNRNGVPIAGATLAALNIVSAQPADAANTPGYSVVVSNSAGSATAGPVTLAVVATPPVRLALQYWREGDFPDRPTGTGRWIEEWVWVEAHWEETGHWEDTDGDGVEDTWIVDGRSWVPGGMRLETRWQEDIAADGLFGSLWATTTGPYGSPSDTGATALLSSLVDRGHLLETYRPGAGEVAMRAWASAPGGNCGDFRFAVFLPGGNPAGLTGTIPAGGYADIRLPTWLWGAGYYRIELRYVGATATAIPAASVNYWIAVGRTLPPRIIQQPAPSAQRVAAGSVVSYVLNASDASSFQWHKDGAPIVGATAAVLPLGPVSTAQAGTYRADAINAAGRTLSDPVLLEVTAGPLTDTDGDGAPDSIERLLGANPGLPAGNDSANATLRLRIHQP